MKKIWIKILQTPQKYSYCLGIGTSLFVDVPFAIKSPFESERVPSTKAIDLPSLITSAAAITIPGLADFKKVIFLELT